MLRKSTDSNLDRRTALKTLGGSFATLSLAGCIGGNQDSNSEWPSNNDTITMIVPLAPGGSYDWHTRQLTEPLKDHLPNEPDVVVENVEGGSTIVGTNQVWNANPDGNTILNRHGLNSILNQLGQPDDVEYDVRDFTHLGTPSVGLYGIVQHPDMDPIEDWQTLVELAPEVTWGGGGAASWNNIFVIMLGEFNNQWEESDLEFVNYDGIGEAMPAMDRDEIDLYAAGIDTAFDYIDEGLCQPVVSFTQGDEINWEDTPRLGDWDMENSEEPVNAFRAPRPYSGPPDMDEERAEIFADALWEAMNDDRYVSAAEEAERDVSQMDADETAEMTEDIYNTWSGYEDRLQEMLGGQ